MSNAQHHQGAQHGPDPAPGTAMVTFSTRDQPHDCDIERAHGAMTAGLAAVRALLGEGRPDPLRSVVLVADDAPGTAASLLASFVSCFGKTLARELARGGTTVNMVGGDVRNTPDLRALVQHLLSDEARFVTGQSFGTAGVRLATPVAAPPPVPVGGWLLVSGGAGAIGSAVTRRLHADGWKVLIGHRGRTEADALAHELSPDGTSCRAIELDIEDASAIRDTGHRLSGQLAGLVLCSGWNLTHPFHTTDADEWERTLRINFTGPALLASRVFGDAPGVVVAIGSEAGRAGDAGRAVYAGGKAAIARYMSLFAASGRVRAATVAPGPVDTPLLRGTHGEDPADVEKGLDRLARLIPLGRMGRPDEIAAAVAFAASPHGGAVNGDIMSVGGGITMQ